jgi:transcriptional regulator with XRE-family HTH domain
MLTAEQIRAGRALLRWSAQELADKASIGISTVQRMENAEGVPSASGKNLDAVQRALQHAGVIFLDENGEGPGVRLANKRAKR